jgi:hypothetical protein
MGGSDELLKQVKHAARFGRVVPAKHARERMAERGVFPADVEKAIATATRAIEQPEDGTIRLEGGVDVDGQVVKVVVALDQRGLRLVTVM